MDRHPCAEDFLHREHGDRSVLGRRLDVEALAGRSSPLSGSHELAETICSDEVLDPTGRGDVVDVDWAEGPRVRVARRAGGGGWPVGR